jgi:hypothetical protein
MTTSSREALAIIEVARKRTQCLIRVSAELDFLALGFPTVAACHGVNGRTYPLRPSAQRLVSAGVF